MPSTPPARHPAGRLAELTLWAVLASTTGCGQPPAEEDVLHPARFVTSLTSDEEHVALHADGRIEVLDHAGNSVAQIPLDYIGVWSLTIRGDSVAWIGGEARSARGAQLYVYDLAVHRTTVGAYAPEALHAWAFERLPYAIAPSTEGLYTLEAVPHSGLRVYLVPRSRLGEHGLPLLMNYDEMDGPLPYDPTLGVDLVWPRVVGARVNAETVVFALSPLLEPGLLFRAGRATNRIRLVWAGHDDCAVERREVIMAFHEIPDGILLAGNAVGCDGSAAAGFIDGPSGRRSLDSAIDAATVSEGTLIVATEAGVSRATEEETVLLADATALGGHSILALTVSDGELFYSALSFGIGRMTLPD